MIDLRDIFTFRNIMGVLEELMPLLEDLIRRVEALEGAATEPTKPAPVEEVHDG